MIQYLYINHVRFLMTPLSLYRKLEEAYMQVKKTGDLEDVSKAIDAFNALTTPPYLSLDKQKRNDVLAMEKDLFEAPHELARQLSELSGNDSH